MSQPRTVLTSSQVAEKLGKSKRTIQRMADKGELEAFGKLPGPNGAYLFDPKVVEEYLKPAPGVMRLHEEDRRRQIVAARNLKNSPGRVVLRTGTDS